MVDVSTTPSVRVEKLLEPAECAKCSWSLEPGESVVGVGDAVFCSGRCYRLARFDPSDLELGGEA